MSRSVRMVGAALTAFTLPVAWAGPARANVPPPPTNDNLPRKLDVASPYVPQSTCDPDPKPGVTAFARLMANHYGEFSYGISRACNYGLTEHSEGRALDWMLNAYDPHEREVANSVISWLLAPDEQGRPAEMARRFGIMYIIWNKQIWGTYQMSEGWRPYNGPNPHTDHIHFSFSWDGAMQRTSWWTGQAWTGVSTGQGGPTVPVLPPDSYPTLREGSSGPDVRLAQQVLGVTPDGEFGPGTKGALLQWQEEHDIPATGVLDKATWDKMVDLGEVSPRGDGQAGGLSSHFDTSIRLGSTGEAVKALQRELKIPVDGIFGQVTDRAVREFQEARSLRADGVVNHNVWMAIAGRDYVENGTSKDSGKDEEKASDAEKDEDQKPDHEEPDKPEPTPTSTTSPEPEKDEESKEPKPEEAEPTPSSTSPTTSSEPEKAEPEEAKPEETEPTPSSTSPTTSPEPEKAAPEEAKPEETKPKEAEPTPSSTSPTTSPQPQETKPEETKPEETKPEETKPEEAEPTPTSTSSTTSPQPERTEPTQAPAPTAVATPSTSGSSTSPSASPSPSWAFLRKTTEFDRVKDTVLSPGSRGAKVKILQRGLGGVAVDGTYGTTTEKAVRAFQGAKGLEVTGVVGEETWDALEERKYPLLHYRTTVLKPGSSGHAVTVLQANLGVPETGQYGPETKEAVRELQARYGLTKTGYVGAVTWEALEQQVSSR